MDAVREWAAALCAVVVLCCGANLILPEGKNSKMMRAVLSLVIMCVLVSPLSGIKSCDTDFAGLEQQFTQPDDRLIDTLERQTRGMIDNSLTALIEDELYAMDITAEKIYIDMDISPEGCISIGQVTVTLDSSCGEGGRVAEELRKRLGLDVQTVISEEEQWS